MSTARSVRTIPPTISRQAVNNVQFRAKKRVAAYARVSTDTDEQFTSFAAQVEYYTRKINENIEWDLIDVYTDEGISATNTKKRDGFNRMISDAMNGKIDLILTKSVSRFARNTVDTLTTVRKLKDKNVEVYFEKENIFTLDAKGELLITIMSSLAQEESRSISENVAWGKRAKAAEGKVYLPYKRFLGYEKGENGLPQIVESEAKIVRMIYRLFLEGKMPSAIARHLTDHGILTPARKTVWQSSTVESILTNEKYKGDAILQKTFCTDFLTKKMKVNEGELPQYYVEQSHPAIIDPEVFDEVQLELKKRKDSGYSSRGGCFSSRIICGECGAYYGPKVWHSTSKYKRTIWQCNRKFKDGKCCSTPHLYEDEIKAAFVDVMNRMIEDKDTIIADYKVIIDQLTDTTALDVEERRLTDESEIVLGLINKVVAENASEVLDQNDYNQRFSDLTFRYEAIKEKTSNNIVQRLANKIRKEKLTKFIHIIEEGKIFELFEFELCISLVKSMTINSDKSIAFTF